MSTESIVTDGRYRHLSQASEASDAPVLGRGIQEPIRKPGKTQPHGVLMVFVDLRRPPVAYSGNVSEFFALDEPSSIETLSLFRLFGPDDVVRLHKALIASEKHARPTSVRVTPLLSEQECLCLTHRLQRHVYFEFFPTQGWPPQVMVDGDAVNFELYLSDLMSRARILQYSHTQDLDSLGELGDYFVEAVQRVIGFDHVKLVKFLPDWSSEVVAEALNPSKALESHLGLRFPESDIPSQARALYQLTPIRYIADIEGDDIQLMETHTRYGTDQSKAPCRVNLLDMSFCFLRGASPLHVQYLKNLGVKASAGFSILVNGQLWGVVLCHHFEPRPTTYERLIQAEIVVQQLATALASRFQGELLRMHHQIAGVFRRLSAAMNRGIHIFDALRQNGNLLNSFCAGDGFAVCLDKAYVTYGTVPSTETLSLLSFWLEPKMAAGHFVSDHLVREFPAIQNEVAIAAGLLAVGGILGQDSSGSAFKLLWFRKETVKQVLWAGEPKKVPEPIPTDCTAYESAGLQIQDIASTDTRRTFERWQELLHNRSLPWDGRSLSAAKELYGAIVQIMAPQYFKLEQMNERLKTTVEELEHFSRAIAHDLRAPLRALIMMPHLVREAAAVPGREADIIQYAHRIETQALRMEALMRDLMIYSTLDNGPVEVHTVDLQEQVNLFIEALPTKGIASLECVEQPFAPLHAPRSEVALIVSNALKNAMQHHHDAQSCHVKLSMEPDGHDFVRIKFEDNGPGIAAKDREKVLQAFTTLCPKSDSEGSGLGLAIIDKLVKRYGGSVIIEESSLASAVKKNGAGDASGAKGQGVCVTIRYPRDVRLVNHCGLRVDPVCV